MFAPLPWIVTLLLGIFLVVDSRNDFSTNHEKLREALDCPPGDTADQTRSQQYHTLLNCEKVGNISQEIAPMLETSFAFLDRNSDGEVDLKEIQFRFKQVHTNLQTEDENKFKYCNTDNSKGLDKNEYSLCSVVSYGAMMEKAQQMYMLWFSVQDMNAYQHAVYVQPNIQPIFKRRYRYSIEWMQYKAVEKDSNNILSRPELDILINQFSKVFYKPLAPSDKAEVIDSLQRSSEEGYSLHDVVYIDTTLMARFLNSLHLASRAN